MSQIFVHFDQLTIVQKGIEWIRTRIVRLEGKNADHHGPEGQNQPIVKKKT